MRSVYEFDTRVYSTLITSIHGRIAQSVERWSNKPLVKGSSPFVTTFFCAVLLDSPTPRIRGRAVKALRSGRSHLWWRGFESHRMQWVFFCAATRTTTPTTTTETDPPQTDPPQHTDTTTENRKQQKTENNKKRLVWRYRDSSPGQADHNRLC